MRIKDFDQTIDLLDEEVVDIVDSMDQESKSSEKYGILAENLNTMLENQQLAVRTRNERLAGKVPAWGISIGTAVLGFVFGSLVLKIDQSAAISDRAISVWDKVIRKF